jgi:hypothetical protein
VSSASRLTRAGSPSAPEGARLTPTAARVAVAGPRRTALGLVAAAGVLLLGATGCTGLDEANAAGISRDDLVSEIATQLAGAATLTYTATYQLTGGETATITQSQKPERTAYVYPGGRMTVTAEATVRCAAEACTETTPAPAADHTLPGNAMVTPETVLAMLNTAALDAKVTTQEHDTTIAGHHATCLKLDDVTGGPAKLFTVCVTNEGALGSFTATMNGANVDVALTSYRDEADENLFVVPKSAKIIDKRAK